MEADNHDYKCQKCGLQYLQPGSRRLHIQQVHPEIATTCEVSTEFMHYLFLHGIKSKCSKNYLLNIKI